MTKVNFYDTAPDEKLKFAVIIAKKDGKLIFCKHRERNTLEFPGGHREIGEAIDETAKRELYEETGATDFDIKKIGIYSVKGKTKINKEMGDEVFGALFYADVYSLESDLHSEIEKIIITNDLPDNWTYPDIQPRLFEYYNNLTNAE